MTTMEPKLEYRNEQPYVAIRTQVTIPFGDVLDQLFPEVFAWLEKQGSVPTRAPFIRYLVVEMPRLDIEVGVPVETAVSGDGRISAGVLPAGRYAVLVHTGPYDGLLDATARLLAWAEENGIVWQTSKDGKTWGARIEFYLTNPAEEPDPQNWQTELAFLVAADQTG